MCRLVCADAEGIHEEIEEKDKHRAPAYIRTKGRALTGWLWRRKMGTIVTFSSSLRFSLRFLRRLAISARRIACSSTVRCFFV